MTQRRFHLLLLVTAASAALATAAAAAPANDVCMTCHSSRDLTRSGPGSASSVHVDATVLAGSAHRDLACASCHRDAVSASHPDRLAKVDCSSCHAAAADSLRRGAHAGSSRSGAGPTCKACHGTHGVAPAARAGDTACATCHTREVEDYHSSVHGVAIASGDPEAATCRDCHGPAHSVASHLDRRATTFRANLGRTCARCHADRELVTRRQITIPEAYALYAQSVHGRSKDPRAATCNDCHGGHRIQRAADPTSSIYRAHIPETCGRCHPAQARAYLSGIHGEALARGVTAVPTCIDCHGEHRIRGPRDPESPVAASAVTMTCSRCHEAESIRQTYGLPAGRLSTYRDSYHGLAARGGSPAVANCASCHGYHDVLPSNDPRSSVSPQRLAVTCGKCHPGAGQNVLAGPVHMPMARPSNPILFWARLIYLGLIVGVIGGMAFHNALDFSIKLGRQRRRYTASTGSTTESPDPAPAASPGRRMLRMTLGERIQHALLAASFFTLVLSGFALKFPEAWPFAWLARLEHGYAWRGLIHRAAAIVMIATAVYHIGTLLTRRGRGLLADMVPRIRDLGDAIANVLYLLRIRSEPPAFDRFGYIEKAEYWALVWGTVVMTVTGFVLWFENQSLRWLEKWVLDLATIVHYYEAWLAFLAILVWHIYQNVLNPDVYPMNWSWITGYVPEEQHRHEHRREWERLKAEEARLEEERRKREEMEKKKAAEDRG